MLETVAQSSTARACGESSSRLHDRVHRRPPTISQACIGLEPVDPFVRGAVTNTMPSSATGLMSLVFDRHSAHREKTAATGRDGIAIGRQFPAGQKIIEHGEAK